MLITDCHIHIQPMEMFKPHALELMKTKRPNFDQIAEFCRSPKAFLKHLDEAGIDRAVLINYVAPEVIGFTSGVNQFIADWDGGYDVDRYPSYGLDWKNSGRPSAIELERLGVYDLAARQEAFTRRRRSEVDQ